jgi:hypothetical protein
MDERIAQVGKLAIAACILKAEKRSTLYVDRSNLYNKLDLLAAESIRRNLAATNGGGFLAAK